MDEAREPSTRPLSTLWWRFSAYSVNEGVVPTIHPTATAKAEFYDPFEADRAAPSEDQRPYKQLLRLAQQADFSKTRFDVPKRQRQRLEQWVRHNGLLGILPHEALEYRSTPHWRELPEELVASFKRGERPWAPYQVEIRRTAAGWATTYHRVGAEQPAGSVRRGEPVDPKLWNDFAAPAEIAYRSWPKGEIIREPVGSHFAGYFGASSLQAADEREYPSPSALEFWHDYGEPVGLLLRYAWHLANGLVAFEGPRSELWQERNALLFLEQINDAAFGTSLAGWLDDKGKVQLQWSATSLLGCFAIMILQDLAGGQRVMRCPVCSGVFLAKSHQAKFCSKTCRDTYHKREQRRREAEEES